MSVKDSSVDSRGPPLVSIIIPALNSASTIRETLRSVFSQTYKNIEVIVVDGGSKDSTKDMAEELGAAVFSTIPDRSGQVNLGVKHARGEYVYRVDSDFVLEPTVVEEAVGECKAGANAVLIHNSSDPTISAWSRARKLERDCYRDENIHVAVRFVRKLDFDRVGGFLENLVAAEDYDLHNRLVRMGVRIGRTNAQEMHIGEPRHLKDVVLKHVYYGKNIRDFIQTNPNAWGQITPFRTAFLHHWRDFTKDPLTTMTFFVYEYVRYASAIAGALVETTSGA